MKSWQVLLMVLGGVAVVCCAGGGFLGYRVFNSAKAVDGQADHYADAVFPIIAATWDEGTLEKEMAPEWTKGQSAADTNDFLIECKELAGVYKSSSPFSTVNTQYRNFGGQSVTYVTVISDAHFTKADARVNMTLAKRQEWKIVALHLVNVKRLKQGSIIEAKGFFPTD